MSPKIRNRLFILLIFCACALPVVASLLAYYVWQPSGRMNSGELLKTLPLPAGSFVDASGREVRLQADGKWTLLLLDSGACDVDCQHRLYDVRQVWLSFELNHDRLQRAWAISDSIQPDAALLRAQPGLRVVRATDVLLRFFPQPSAGRIYLIDDRGNQVLRYQAMPDAKKMIKDIARLLLVKKM